MSENIEMTDVIRNKIKSGRKKRRINSVILSKEIGKSEAYISHLENGKIKKVNLYDLKRIIEIVLEIKDAELDRYVNDLIFVSSDNTIINEDSVNLYKRFSKISTEENFKIGIEKINKIFSQMNKEDNYVYTCISSFLVNLDFDSGFMISLLSLPFHTLKEFTNTSDRESFLFDVLELINKYKNKTNPIDEKENMQENH